MITERIVYLEGSGEQIEGLLCLPEGFSEEGNEKVSTVVVAHGFGGCWRFFTGNVARALAERGFAAYAFNFRNPDTRNMFHTSVLTEAKTLAIVLDGIGRLSFVDPERLYLLGESQGGFVSAYVSARRRDVKKLVLCYPAFVLQDDAKRRNPGYSEPGYTYPETEKIGDNYVSGTYSEAALSFDIYDVIRDYKNDVLLIHGTADPVVPLAYSERAAKTYEKARLEVIEGTGHGFYFGEPFERAAELTAAFLRDGR
ncbi:MAG: alpha/beta fold hydrolase [Clostridia bacterium]|nr:alpha/beta fold hydrolase [Clostridia bacterium]